MKKVWIGLVMLVLALCCTGCFTIGPKDEESSKSVEQLQEMIASIGTDAVEVTVNEVTMWTTSKGRATIIVQVPNYTELLTAAYQADDSDRVLADAIEQKAYTMVTYTGYASVTVKDGNQVISYEEVVNTFIEQELIKAINAVYDAENTEQKSQ